MSEKKNDDKPPSISMLESKLYSSVEVFFRSENQCERTGSAQTHPTSLRIFGGTIFPDVFGIKSPSKPDFTLFMAEGKRSFKGRSFDECKGQAISLQRFADFVYTFFPKGAWEELTKVEKNDIQTECTNLQLGLLIIDNQNCEEKVKPTRKDNLVKEENRQFARDKIIQYFPDFLSVERNSPFFDNYLDLADSIMQECHLLFDELVGCFTKTTGISKQAIKPYCGEDSFEFYMRSETKNGKVYLLIKPFGSLDFEIKRPFLIVEEKYNRSLLKKATANQKLSNRIENCLKNNWRVIVPEYFIFYPDTVKDAIRYIMESESEEFSIMKPIEIIGLEKSVIKEAVEKSLKEAIEFMGSVTAK